MEQALLPSHTQFVESFDSDVGGLIRQHSIFNLKGTPRVTVGAVDVDSTIAEAVEADDARTKQEGG